MRRIVRSARRAVAVGFVAVASVSALSWGAPRTVSAQTPAVDRTKPPTPGPAPTIRVPAWTRTTLANGAQLIVSQKRDLPLVAFSINFIGGTANYEPAEKLGVASFAAQGLSEGTATMTGEQLADAQQMLGTQISVGIGSESGSIGFTALKDKFEPALALVADMLVNPTFPGPAIERMRGRRLVALDQEKEEPDAIAAKVFARVTYGDTHPYGRVVTERTVGAITRDDVVAFARDYFRPGRAVITVAGDVDPEAVKTIVERALARWPAGGSPPTFQYPALPAPKNTTIYLVDKPGSAQSVFTLGHPGPARDTPDFYALQVMNNVLGTLFMSRLNANIREQKGYSYGVGSGFSYGRGPGPFEAGGGIVTEKTDSALIEFMKELRGAQGAIPFTADEIRQGKESLVQSLPRRFASVAGVGTAIGGIYVQGLPETYFRDYGGKIGAVTGGDMVRVARQHIDLARMHIVIVGDRAKIEAPLRRTGIAPIVRLDRDGNRIIVPVP